ncbi:hypothetical protein NPIL_416851 [Nephila pilipes]|uniref:Uncharacterized protein n=1 Tax=Nephila pilipes TaxID=299642 RepID=A0A8X6T850_NEPPI|nr:hypothetical protein NPIL_416851 [Nephila pilipes]
MCSYISMWIQYPFCCGSLKSMLDPNCSCAQNPHPVRVFQNAEALENPQVISDWSELNIFSEIISIPLIMGVPWEKPCRFGKKLMIPLLKVYYTGLIAKGRHTRFFQLEVFA